MLLPEPQFPPVLDSSIMAAWKACRHKAFMTYFLHFKPKGESVHLVAGKAFAKGLETARKDFYENGFTEPDAIASGYKALIKEYGTFECPPTSGKSLMRTADAMCYYFEQNPMSRSLNIPALLPGGKRAIEFSFSEPIDVSHPDTSDPILYVGRMDTIDEFMGGLWVHDDKTTAYLGAGWVDQWHLRSQFTGYTWGAKRNGLDVVGVLVDGTSILKTKYECARAMSYRPQWMIDEWYEQLLGTVREMIEIYQYYTSWASRNKFYKNLDEACTSYGRCAFYDVCRSSDVEPWLLQGFERRVWDPVNRLETTLPPARRSRVTLEVDITHYEKLDEDNLKAALDGVTYKVNPLGDMGGAPPGEPPMGDPPGSPSVALPPSDPLSCLCVPALPSSLGEPGSTSLPA